MTRHVSIVDVAALDIDDEPIPPLPAYEQMLFERRAAQIEQQTPAWVRACRARGHFVALIQGPPKKCTFRCTQCGRGQRS